MGERVADAQRAPGAGGGAPLEEGDGDGADHQNHREFGGFALIGCHRVSQQHGGHAHQYPFQQEEDGGEAESSDGFGSGQTMHGME